MKRIYTILATVLITASVFAQTPEKMTYQSVIRNTSNQLVTNQGIGIRISILQTTTTGTVVYAETHNTNTNANGLVTIEIGNGTIESGDFTTIDWSNDIYFIKTETDPTQAGGTAYTISGTSQLLSVPYALHAKTAETITGGIEETDPVFTDSEANNITAADITNLSNLSGTNTGNQDISGIAINTQAIQDTASQIRADIPDVSSFVSIETDPFFSNWNKSYNDLTNKPNIVDTVSAVIDTTTQFVRKYSQWIKNGNNLYYNNGVVGIGVEVPTASLDIYDNVGYPFLNFVSEDNVYTNWISDRMNVDDYLVGIDGGNNRFMFANLTTGNYSLVFQDDNVGVGALSPTFGKLQIENDGLIPQLYFEVPGEMSFSWQADRIAGNNTLIETISGIKARKVEAIGAGTTLRNTFYYDYNSGNEIASVVFDENGNVGIGNTGPNAKLEVNANASNVGLIVNANATTPGNIQEWNNGSGTTLNYVPSNGGIVFENLNTPDKGIRFMADQTTGVSGAYGVFQPAINNTSGGMTIMPKGNGNFSSLSVCGTDILDDPTNARQFVFSANQSYFYIWPRNYGTETAKPLYIYKPGNVADAAISIATDGNVGVNTATPEAPLHINDFMKLEPRDTAPSSPSKGMIYYDNLGDKLKVYTGSVWEDLN